ncbi:MAG: hypothetical protein PHW63_04490 [Alphaproteobacteria bacterium]|nr:hypothetical protein [Alphaproteobacteria bacterium]
MTQNDQTSPSRDWAKLAQDALDLWQTHLNTMANDPKMKEDMARMVTPMGEMFTQWSTLMQAGLQNMEAQRAPAAEAAQTPSASTPPTSTSFAPDPAGSAAPDAAPDVAVFSAAKPEPQDVMTPLTVPAVTGHETVLSATPAQTPEAEAPVLNQASLLSPVVEQTTNDLTAILSSLTGSGPDSTLASPSTASESDQSPARGRAASADGPRDLAQLASRLAELERELEGMRSRGGKRTGAELSSSDAADAGDVQRMAGASTGPTSR